MRFRSDQNPALNEGGIFFRKPVELKSTGPLYIALYIASKFWGQNRPAMVKAESGEDP